VLSKEVATNYASIVADSPLPPIVQYHHYLQSQEGYLPGSAYTTEAAYWKNKLQKRGREYCAENCMFGPFSGEFAYKTAHGFAHKYRSERFRHLRNQV
jgi:hypothetical protein